MQKIITQKKWLRLLCCSLFAVFMVTSTVSAQTVSTAGGTGYLGNIGINNSAPLLTSFVIQNTGATALTLTSVSSQMAPGFGGTTAGTISTNKLYMSTTSLGGNFDVSTAAWSQVATGTSTVPAAVTIVQCISGANIVIPAGAQYRFALELSNGLVGSTNLVPGNPLPTPSSFTVGNVTLKLGDIVLGGGNIGYIGVSPMPDPGNTAFWFGGSVTLASSVPCAGTPAPGNTLSSVAGACLATPFTLSLQNATSGSGVTYQWQSSTNGTTYANIPGATSATYTVANQTVATYYQAIVTCSGSSTTSTPKLVTQNAPGQCYCTAGATNTSTSFEKIANVKFGTINNASTSFAGYENFLNLTPVADFVAGATYPITITGNANVYSGDVVSVWIDYNQNGNFTDPGENVYLSAESAGPYNGNVIIPASATLGNTRMRIRLYDDIFGNGVSGPCGLSDYGQVEDYTVNIVPCVPVTFTSQPVDKSVACGSNTFFQAKTTGSNPTFQWQYRTSATGVWLNVPNAAPFSGVNTDSLGIAGANASQNGYQFRVLASGACSAANPSSPATLTVTALVAAVTPAAPTICAGSIQQLSLTNTLGNINTLNEGFDVAIPLPAGWAQKNNSVPAGALGWFQGNDAVFTSHSGGTTSYIGANFNSVTGNNTISNWLLTPQLSLKNGDVFTFWTRTVTPVVYADRMQVRMSTAGASTNVGATNASVGDFTTLLVDINPGLTLTGYPDSWTKYTFTMSGLTGTVSGRFAFRYFVQSGGPSGANSSYIGVDDVSYQSSGGPAQGLWTSTATGTIFTDATATVPYVTGTPANTVYVKPTTTSTYTVSYTTGACTSTPANVVVKVNSAATAVAAVADKSTCLNGSAKFGSAVTGGVGVVKVWQVSTDGGASYTNLTNGGVYAGVATDTLTITGATAAMNGNKYRLSTSAAPCTGSPVVSTAGTLTVFPAPAVVLSAAPSTALFPGLTSTLTVAVSPTTAVTYMWYKDGVLIPGVTGNMLSGVTVDGFGTYTVKITDNNGCSGTSNAITIRDSANGRLFIYPSPNNGQFQVRYYNDGSVYQTSRRVVVYDSKGARVFSKQFALVGPYVNMSINLANHGTGVYHVDVVDAQGNRLKTGSVVVL